MDDWARDDGERARQVALWLLILRLGLGGFLLVWGLEKLMIPARTVRIYDFYYGFALDTSMAPLLGLAQCLIVLAMMAGLWRRWSYGFAVLIHAYSTVATWRQIIDPWGLVFGEVKHLYLAAVPILAALIVLYMLREHDIWSIDGWWARRAARAAEAGDSAP